MELVNFSRLQRALAKLPDQVLKKEARKYAYAAMEPILHAARSKVPVDTGQLAASLKITGFRSANWRFSILVVAGDTKNVSGDDIGHLYKGETYYAGMVEWGHRLGSRSGRTGMSMFQRAVTGDWKGWTGTDQKGNKVDTRREVAAQPFLRPALDEQKDRAMDILLDGLHYTTLEHMERGLA